MYTVLFLSGRTLTFSNKAIAETYVVAYRGVLIGCPVIPSEPVGISQIKSKIPLL